MYIGNSSQAHYQVLLPKADSERVLEESESEHLEFGGMDMERDISLKRQKGARLAKALYEAGKRTEGISRTHLCFQG